MNWLHWYTLAAEVPAPPSELSGLADIPKMVTDLGWVGVAILVTFMFATNRWMSQGQHEKLMEKEREVTAVWKQNAEELKPALQELIESLAPIGQGNAAILKAVEALQASNELDRRFRDRGRE
jgi:hypothetical protein